MTITEAFDEIMLYAHMINWGPDWQVTKEVYSSIPNSYSVLTPFAYSYLEEMIRSTTSEYGRVIFDDNNTIITHRKVGMKLINLAISENKENKKEYSKSLEELKSYYYTSKDTDKGDNRHSVAHGFMHPRYWSQKSFEKLILDIARISKYSEF